MCGGGHGSSIHEVRDEVVDLGRSHFARVAFVVVEDELANPGNVGCLGTQGIVSVAEGFAVDIQQFFFSDRSSNGVRCSGHDGLQTGLDLWAGCQLQSTCVHQAQIATRGHAIMEWSE